MELINAIAATLQVSENQIKSIDTWAKVYFVKFNVGRPTFVSKAKVAGLLSFIKPIQMETKKRLLPKNHAILKPQNQFSELIQNKAKQQVSEWLQGFELNFYSANLLAAELVSRVIEEKIKSTPASAPSVYFADSAKVESLAFRARQVAGALDESGELEALLSELTMADARHEGNSI